MKVRRSPSRTVRYVVRGARSAAGTAFSVATVAAMAALTPISASASPGSGSDATGPAFSRPVPAQGAGGGNTRLAGVRQDLARAVSLGQVTPEQARRFEAKLSRRISS